MPVHSQSMARRAVARASVVSRPVVWERVARAARVTVVAAPAGSGKTVLLRSWISDAGLAGNAAWVAAGRDERDPQRFWLSVLSALGGWDLLFARYRWLCMAG